MKNLVLIIFVLLIPGQTAVSQSTGAASGAARASASPSASRTVEGPPEKAKPLRIARLDKPPVIDGKLNDEVWKQAVVLKDFYQTNPGDNIAPSKPTEMMMRYAAGSFYT